MPRNGSGTYSLPQAAFVPGTTISSANVNSDLADIAAQLTNSVAADGQTTMTGALKLVDGTLSQPALTFGSSTGKGIANLSAGSMSFINGGTAVLGINFAAYGVTGNVIVQAPNNAILMPVGTVVDFAGATAPGGWLLCFGQVLAQVSYPELFLAIGATYNTGGEGTGNFRLPDCRGRITAGQDNMGGSAANRVTNAGSGIVGTTLGATGGAQNQTATTDQIPAHTHAFSATSSGQSQTHTHGPGVRATNMWGSPGNSDQTNLQIGSGLAVGQNSATGNASVDHTHTVSGTSSANTTAGNPITTMNPAIIFNKIIFAAR
jgi:microcystin-dependent protein